MMGKERQSVGRKGEELAARYLAGKGFRVLERNYRAHRGEIDIIAMEGEVLVFVEVKTVRGTSFGEPQTRVDFRKQQQIGKVAGAYLQEKDLGEIDCRFDVIAITSGGRDSRVKHIRDAFWLEE